MTDDDILKALGQAAREEAESDPLDARWDALAAGTLDADAEAELRQLAAEDPEMAAALAAFEPRDDALDERIAAAIVAEVAQAPPAPEVPAEAPADNVVELAAWRRRAVLITVPVLAAAAAIILLLRPTVELPQYSLEALSGEKAVRGDDPASATYGPGSAVDLVLRPAQDTAEAVTVVVFDRFDGAYAKLATQPTVQPNGAARLKGTVEQVLPQQPGAHTLVFVVAPAKAAPKSVDDLRAGLEESPPPWQVLEYPYRLVSR